MTRNTFLYACMVVEMKFPDEETAGESAPETLSLEIQQHGTLHLLNSDVDMARNNRLVHRLDFETRDAFERAVAWAQTKEKSMLRYMTVLYEGDKIES